VPDRLLPRKHENTKRPVADSQERRQSTHDD
jgi:hypothetical protein